MRACVRRLSQSFELTRRENGLNLRPMEGLRGFAVFLVFLVHYATFVRAWVAPGSLLGSFAAGIHTIGNAGVNLFFVLSRYLIYGSLISREQFFSRFMLRRIERIYPAFLAVFGVYVLLSFLMPSESKIPAPALSALIYLGENILLLPGLLPIEPLITVAWSLRNVLLPRDTDRNRAPVAARPEFSMARRPIPAPGSALGLLALCAGLIGMLLPWRGSAASAFKTAVLCLSFFPSAFAVSPTRLRGWAGFFHGRR